LIQDGIGHRSDGSQAWLISQSWLSSRLAPNEPEQITVQGLRLRQQATRKPQAEAPLTMICSGFACCRHYAVRSIRASHSLRARKRTLLAPIHHCRAGTR
jgi:hypothetical protein